MNLPRASAAALATSLALATPTVAQLVVKDIDVAGVAREYLVYLPAGYDGTTDLPVLLNYHGGDSTMWDQLALTDMRPLADAEQFILVHPQGLPNLDGEFIWDSVGPWSIGTDEIGYASAMIDALDADYAVDVTRVYATGYSNGGNMVWELACFLSDKVAAVAAVAGSMWEWTEDLCTPTRPVPVMSIHGTLDFYNPWGGLPPFSLGLIAASEYWVHNANGDLTPTIVDIPNTVPGDGSIVDHYTWSGGDDCVSIEHFKVQNGGHDWPGVFGNMDIDANTEIWNFVSRYSLNGLIGCNACSVVPIGVGAGGANIGTLDSPSTPSLGSTLQLDYAGFNGASVGLLAISTQGVTVSAFGGTVFANVIGPAALLPVATAPDGSGSASGPLGTAPSLVGVKLTAQVGVVDATQVAGVALSNGLEIGLCSN